MVLAGALEILGTSVRAPFPWWANTAPHYRDEVEEFVKECGSLCPPLTEINLVVKDDLLPFEFVLKDAIAMCRIYILNLRLVREVTIDLRYKGLPMQQKATMWHELAHCILFEDHVQRFDFDLMDPHDRSNDFYVKHWDALVKATFCRIAADRRIERKDCPQ